MAYPETPRLTNMLDCFGDMTLPDEKSLERVPVIGDFDSMSEPDEE